MTKTLKLRKTLFWDVDIKKINKLRKPDFVVGRVLDFGNIQEWKTIKNLYSMKRIKETAKKHIFPNARNANFWSIILNIPLEELQCMRKLLLKTPRAFLKLDVVGSRGSRKDFVDIYFLLKQYSLEELLSFVRRKFAGIEL